MEVIKEVVREVVTEVGNVVVSVVKKVVWEEFLLILNTGGMDIRCFFVCNYVDEVIFIFTEMVYI